MKLHKRKKPSRHRGTRTAGWAMKKHKGGKGNSGGKGMAGTGKRADHKKSWVLVNQYPYFGKQGFTSKGTENRSNDVYNLDDIEGMLLSNKAKNGVLELKQYKVLGDGEITQKAKIHAKAFSKSAKEKIQAAGGEAIVVAQKRNEPKEGNKEFLEEKKAAKEKKTTTEKKETATVKKK
ncbi:MAG: uL15 family ribosomal protein [Nanoarchaeota archaeon]